jgi:hypothetical protein
MIFRTPVSYILFITALCLTLSSLILPVFLIPIALPLSITGIFTGFIYKYTEPKSILLNRIGLTGNILLIIATVGGLYFLLANLV